MTYTAEQLKKFGFNFSGHSAEAAKIYFESSLTYEQLLALGTCPNLVELLKNLPTWDRVFCSGCQNRVSLKFEPPIKKLTIAGKCPNE